MSSNDTAYVRECFVEPIRDWICKLKPFETFNIYTIKNSFLHIATPLLNIALDILEKEENPIITKLQGTRKTLLD